MESRERQYICHRALCEVFMDNAYASLQLGGELRQVEDERDRAYITSLFYGVLEKNVQLDYLIGKLVAHKPKTSVAVVLKIGIYRLRYMSEPDYAVINETVELAKRLGKTALSGFVNAILRKSAEIALPAEGETTESVYLSVNNSVPEWICKALISQYGYEFAKAFLACEPKKMTHIRRNSRVISEADFEQKLEKFDYERTKLGYYVTHNVMKSLKTDQFTVQSLSSMIAVHCYLGSGIPSGATVLDLCGAPGGKSIYLEELCDGAKIYCYDVHPHRVELIKKYARRMKSSITPAVGDALDILPEWVGRGDLVICDVPCSGLGVFKNKPDILFNKRPSDIDKLVSVQKNILDNAKNYVKVGGILSYSTCTILRRENEEVIFDFLGKNANFELTPIETPLVGSNDGTVTLFPNVNDGCDGFFVARMRRTS